MLLFLMIIHPSHDYQEEVYGDYTKELEAYKKSLKKKAKVNPDSNGKEVSQPKPDSEGYEVQPYENPTTEEEYA